MGVPFGKKSCRHVEWFDIALCEGLGSCVSVVAGCRIFDAVRQK